MPIQCSICTWDYGGHGSCPSRIPYELPGKLASARTTPPRNIHCMSVSSTGGCIRWYKALEIHPALTSSKRKSLLNLARKVAGCCTACTRSGQCTNNSEQADASKSYTFSLLLVKQRRREWSDAMRASFLSSVTLTHPVLRASRAIWRGTVARRSARGRVEAKAC